MSIGEKTAFRWRMGPTAFLVTATLWLTILEFRCLPVAAQFLPPANVSCACPNQNLTFNCTVNGSRFTVWTGSAFSCGTSNEIILRHDLFSNSTTGICNSGAIVARSIEIVNDSYTSQLEVNVSMGFNDGTVECATITGAGMPEIGRSMLTVITAPLEQVPNNVSLTKVATGLLNFSWNAVNTTCPSINYLASSNCTTWSCVNPTNTTTAVCSGLQLPSVCTFTVQTEVCGQMGLPSEPISVILRVPEKPTLDIIPVYSAGTKDLLRIKAVINKQASFNITDTVLSSVTFYSVSYNSATPLPFNQNTPCMENVCEYLIGVPSDLCLSSNDVSVALSASNILGQGPPSDPTTIECTNQFVEVEYDRTTSTITCRFLDESDTSVKLCTVMYGQCGQELVQTTQGSSTMETPYNIVLSVDGNMLKCYSVTASSDLVTVIIESDVNSEERGSDIVVIVVVIVIVMVMVMVIAVSVLAVITVFVKRKRRPSDNGAQNLISTHTNISIPLEGPKSSTGYEDNKLEVALEDKFKLKRLSMYDFELIEVARDCELREYVKELNLVEKFKTGCVFYEFKHEFESISDDQELIFIDKENLHNYWKVGHKDPLLGLQVKNPNFEEYDIFIQCTGSGTQHLPANSRLLKVKDSPESQFVKTRLDPPLKQIIPFNIRRGTVSTTMTIKFFCESNGIFSKHKYNVFLELGKFEKKSDVFDVILQDKESQLLYTGPTARKMVNQYYSGRNVPGLDKWLVFVLCTFDMNMELQKGTKFFHQVPECALISIDDFHSLTVDKDEHCMCIYDFVKKKAKVDQFTNGNAFYELTEGEDLRYYRDVVHLESETNKLKTNIDLFYGLPGVFASYGLSVFALPRGGKRVFIQNTTQGARCVKHGDTILYRKKTVKSVSGDPHRGQATIGDDEQASSSL